MQKLKKPWSISTTVRNPERIRGFLSVIRDMEGAPWDKAAQMSFQIRLIQRRLFGYGEKQFYQDLSRADISLLESGGEISFDKARDIFAKKQYEDPAMRGRVSFKALQKFGFVSVEGGGVQITGAGHALLKEDKDYGDIFLRALLKWQIPNALDRRGFPEEHGYNIKPFAGVLRLIDAVNRRCRRQKVKEKGVSFDEFALFALTLIDWRKVEETADDIMRCRRENLSDGERMKYRAGFNLRHIGDYADNVIRYFRMTKYVCLRGFSGNRYIDLEPSRKVEILSLLQRDNAEPIRDFGALGGSYVNYLTAVDMPPLPGESGEELRESIALLNAEIKKAGGIAAPAAAGLSVARLKSARDVLRGKLRALIRNRQKTEARDPAKAEKLIGELRALTGRGKPEDGMPKPLKLEMLVARVLEDVLNDAEEIISRCPKTEDGIPAHTAPGGVADIECYYRHYAATCEVTMLADSKQWMHEGQPVMRHLKDFAGNGRVNAGGDVYCLFVAPKIHPDSLNWFKYAAHQGFEGARRQRIAPLPIALFCDVAEECVRLARAQNRMTSARIKALLDALADSVRDMDGSDEWTKRLPRLVERWKQAA